MNRTNTEYFNSISSNHPTLEGFVIESRNIIKGRKLQPELKARFQEVASIDIGLAKKIDESGSAEIFNFWEEQLNQNQRENVFRQLTDKDKSFNDPNDNTIRTPSPKKLFGSTRDRVSTTWSNITKKRVNPDIIDLTDPEEAINIFSEAIMNIDASPRSGPSGPTQLGTPPQEALDRLTNIPSISRNELSPGGITPPEKLRDQRDQANQYNSALWERQLSQDAQLTSLERTVQELHGQLLAERAAKDALQDAEIRNVAQQQNAQVVQAAQQQQNQQQIQQREMQRVTDQEARRERELRIKEDRESRIKDSSRFRGERGGEGRYRDYPRRSLDNIESEIATLKKEIRLLKQKDEPKSKPKEEEKKVEVQPKKLPKAIVELYKDILKSSKKKKKKPVKRLGKKTK